MYAFYEEKLIGIIETDADERLSFQYDSMWLEDPKGFALSFALPLRVEAFGHLETRAFFENLLPEGQVRRRIEARGRLEQDSDFAFLHKYGRDCAGAISIRSERDRSQENPSQQDRSEQDQSRENQNQKNRSRRKHAPPKLREELALSDIYDALDAHRHVAEVISDRDDAYLSLAGAQDKFPATVEKGKIYLPYNSEPTTHIIKTPIFTYKSTKDSVYNEYFCMILARRIGFDVPGVSIIPGKYPLYVIERFDRYIDAKTGTISRIHQQDFCQAQGIPSSRKYETQGGPGLVENVELLKRHGNRTIQDLRTLLQWVCFNLIIGNNDSHSKNISLLHTSKGCQLAPMYDLISTSIYPEIQTLFAFCIGESNRWEALRPKHFHATEKRLKVRKGLFVGLMHDMCDRVEGFVSPWVKEFNDEFAQVKTARKIAKEINKRIKHFRYQGI